MNSIEAILSATMLAQTIRMSVPYVCAGLGGIWCERSGVITIALEGGLLASGLASVAAAHASGSAVVGIAAATIVGGAFIATHGLLVAAARVDAIISGIALNLVAAGGTRVVLKALYGSSSNSPAIEAIAGSSGSLLVRTLKDPFTSIAILATIATIWFLGRTRFGLRVRACGEEPVAAASVGVDVVVTRVKACAIGGAIVGLGGAALAFDQHQFQAGMSGGRGFIALAAVILSGWRPGRAAMACVLFAALDALQIVLQDRTPLPREVIEMLPYVATLFALVAIGRRGGSMRAPAGLGAHA